MSETPDIYALLIGVDCYLPNKLPDGGSYRSLAGCVRDINNVEEFLKKKYSLAQDHIFKLTATSTDGGEPSEPPEEWPTYKNMVAAFNRLIETAKSGDLVYIQYSGHGGRSKTNFPELKGENGLDESLVPTDIGKPESNYLRDVEIAHLMRAMVKKGLVVTLVFDSCHSGGATRGLAGAVSRGINSIDTTPRPTDSLVSSNKELVETWNELTGGRTRNITPDGGWHLEPKGYSFLAACRANESAYEFAFDGKERNGALTYWMLDSLKQAGPQLTYKMLHDRIVAKVHSQFELQTPQFQGESDRVFFGSELIQQQPAVVVMKVDLPNNIVQLQVGQPQGVGLGAQFAVYPAGTLDFTKVEERLALVKIKALGQSSSNSEIIADLGKAGSIKEGDQAVLLDPGDIGVRRTVCLVKQEEKILPKSIDQDAALDSVRVSLTESNNGFIKLAEENEPAQFQVAVNDKREYEIWDPAGSVIKNLRPVLSIDDQKSTDTLVKRLIHLTKYRNVQELDNLDPYSPLANKLVVELVGKESPDFIPGRPMNPKPFDAVGNTPTIEVGEWVIVRIKNRSSKELNLAALDLQPDWGISQIYPIEDQFEVFHPGRELLLPLKAGLPDSYEQGRDLLKVFATVEAPDFRWLELKPLDKPLERRAKTRSGLGSLERLFAAVMEDAPKTRQLTPAVYPSRGWTMAQVELNIVRSPAN